MAEETVETWESDDAVELGSLRGRRGSRGETNRGLASQEVGRRALEERLDRLDNTNRVLLKRDSAAAGLVSLALGGGLTVYDAIKAGQQPGGSRLANWASRESTHF